MRIALIVPGGVGADGVHDVIPALLSLIERLASRHEVLVLATQQGGIPPRYPLLGSRVVSLGGRRRGPAGRATVAAVALAELRGFRPDVIHAIWLGPGSTIALLAGWVLRRPVISSIGGGELVGFRRIRYGGRLTWRGRLHAGLAIRFSARLSGGSRFALGPVVDRRPDARWLPLGAERALEHRDDGTADAPEATTLRLLAVASVNRVKGPDVILGAIAHLNRTPGLDLRLDWIGQNTMHGRPAALARSLGIAAITAFIGFKPHADVLDRIDAADLLVQGSYHESQGVAVLEAALRGVPTVGTAVGLVAELAELQPPAAIATPIGDPKALAGAISTLARDPARRAAIGAAARAWAMAHDADWTAAQFEALYEEVAARG